MRLRLKAQLKVPDIHMSSLLQEVLVKEVMLYSVSECSVSSTVGYSQRDCPASADW